MKRMQFELSDERYEQLMELMRLCGIETQKDLFQNALGMFEWAIRERQKGRIIASMEAQCDLDRIVHLDDFRGRDDRAARPGGEEKEKYKELSIPVIDRVPVTENDVSPSPYPAGSVVQLRSGGPVMVVQESMLHSKLSVVYYNQVSGELEHNTIDPQALRAANQAPTAPDEWARGAPINRSTLV